MQNRDLWNKTERQGRGPGMPWTIGTLDISKGPDDFGPMLAAKLRYWDLGIVCADVQNRSTTSETCHQHWVSPERFCQQSYS